MVHMLPTLDPLSSEIGGICAGLAPPKSPSPNGFVFVFVDFRNDSFRFFRGKKIPEAMLSPAGIG